MNVSITIRVTPEAGVDPIFAAVQKLMASMKEMQEGVTVFVEGKPQTPKYIDIKASVWQRLTLPDNLSESQVKELYEAVNNEDEIPSWVYEHPEYELEWLTDTEIVDYGSTELRDEDDSFIHDKNNQ